MISLFRIWLGLVVVTGVVSGVTTVWAEDRGDDPARAIDSRLAGKASSTTTYYILGGGDMDHGTNFTWNPNLWCADLTVYFTCFSPWNSNEHAYQGGTLITPKHAIFAEHFSGKSGSNTLRAGEQLVFMGKSGINYRRTLVASPERVGTTDICVGTFKESDLPPDVVPAQLLPAQMKDSDLPPGTPVIFCNKNKEARVAELVSATGVVIRPATDPKRAPWTLSGPAFVGDSGSPIFAVLDGQLVLLALFHAPNYGPALAPNAEAINAVLERGYKVKVWKK